jgi:hypothetical protein
MKLAIASFLIFSFCLVGCVKEALLIGAVTGWAVVEVMTDDDMEEDQVVHTGKVDAVHCYDEACFVSFETGSMYRIDQDEWGFVKVGDEATIVQNNGKLSVK